MPKNYNCIFLAFTVASDLSGFIAYSEGDYNKAISDLNQSNSKTPFDDPLSDYYLALAHIKLGKKTEAIDNLKSAANYKGNVSLTKEIFRKKAKELLSQLSAED